MRLYLPYSVSFVGIVAARSFGRFQPGRRPPDEEPLCWLFGSRSPGSGAPGRRIVADARRRRKCDSRIRGWQLIFCCAASGFCLEDAGERGGGFVEHADESAWPAR